MQLPLWKPTSASWSWMPSRKLVASTADARTGEKGKRRVESENASESEERQGSKCKGGNVFHLCRGAKGGGLHASGRALGQCRRMSSVGGGGKG